jgi:hypothetical protein
MIDELMVIVSQVALLSAKALIVTGAAPLPKNEAEAKELVAKCGEEFLAYILAVDSANHPCDCASCQEADCPSRVQ